ncbi:flagellar hook-basal body complex protein FliE [Microbacterium sp. ISL-103]|jgi:flagellar hook-basal body complex protein FliE|uniref:flagellar hook-basal body complex protein FliE n=1 Tax=Microbacterium sp. ISL-103 TaxID=2819156 RepID=UPI001BECB738|nr:flagellar hook-basal body complex protein FliE [Microbacterium sp. ISL-103]MBT2475996.1 flagellar hook-basal body complex protein FliE [Microbacterium sp. ISL-103]
MSGAIEAVSAAGVTPLSALSFESGPDAAGAPASAGAFATSLTGAVENLQQLQSTSNGLAVQAVTGDLQDIHQAMIASTRASVTLDLVVAVRDRSVSAFNEIMRMQA